MHILRRACHIIGLLFVISPALSAAETLRLAHDENFPPFAYTEDGQSTGMAVDILRAAAQRAGLDITLVPVPFKQIQPSLDDGTADAIFPLAINPERRTTMDFSTPLLMTGGALFVRSPQPEPASLKDLAGKSVVTPKTGPLAGYIQRTEPAVDLVVTTDYDESLRKLVSGEADAAALNYQVGTMLAKKQQAGKLTLPNKMFLELPLAVAVKKDSQAQMLSKLNDGLEEIRQDGTLEKTQQKWMSGE